MSSATKTNTSAACSLGDQAKKRAHTEIFITALEEWTIKEMPASHARFDATEKKVMELQSQGPQDTAAIVQREDELKSLLDMQVKAYFTNHPQSEYNDLNSSKG